MKWFITQEMFFTRFAVYSVFGLIALFLWWVIYQALLARRYSLREAIFGDNPNPAVALDFLGGMLASGILFFFLLRHPTSREFWPNAGTLAWSMSGLLMMLAVLRLCETLGFRLPVSSDNLLGLKHLRAFDLADDVRRLGLSPCTTQESLAEIRWERIARK